MNECLKPGSKPVQEKVTLLPFTLKKCSCALKVLNTNDS